MTGRYTVSKPANYYRVVKRNGQSLKEHRLIVENLVGRKLLPHEHVHHINGDKLDNRPENLSVLHSSDHMSLHHRLTLDIELIKTMRSNGLSMDCIAKELGVSRSAIARRLRDEGMDTQARRPLSWNIEEAIDLISQGISRAEIARRFSVSESSLRKVLRKRGIYAPDTRSKHIYDIERIRALRSTGMSLRGISKCLGISETTFYRYAKCIGL
ncbi:helix-turn-helix domain-containing protein [Acinetobacter sp. 197]|uniref:helix-turn-helix domain-containing protein n=1 Tax=Acinetobacter sp. 197 TaxID=3114696 RepID=UPI003A856DAF